MLKFVVRFLIARLSPSDLIDLGGALTTAGQAAQARQAAIASALEHVRVGVDKLTQ